MAALFCNTRQMVLSDAAQDIGELKTSIAALLREGGFVDVVNTSGEVAGNRGDVRLSVLHLFIGGRSFYELVMAGGEAGDPTLGAVNEVVNKIQNIKFL
jgi:hypothetical protein